MLLEYLASKDPGLNLQQLVATLREPMNPRRLEEAWRRVTARHGALRTRFVWADLDAPRQEELEEVDLPLACEDWRHLAPSVQAERLREFLRADRERGLALDQAPLHRVTLFRLGPEHHEMVWTFHHAIADGRSCTRVLEEVFTTYEALGRGLAWEPAPGPAFATHLAWLSERDLDADEEFWRRQLAGLAAPTSLVRESSRVAVGPPKETQEESVVLPTEWVARLESLAAATGTTLNTLILGAWALLLHRYGGDREVVVGVVRAGRRGGVPDADRMVGVLINTVPFRVRIDPDETLKPWLRRLREQWLALREHEHTPLSKIREWTNAGSRHALFETVLVFEHRSRTEELQRLGGSWRNRSFRTHQKPSVPLVLSANGGGAAVLRADYDPRYFDPPGIRRRLGHLANLLEGMTRDPGVRLRDLPFLAPDERHRLLVEWNHAPADYPRDRGVPDLFAEVVEGAPEAVALVFEGGEMTYAELNARANRLARLLRTRGVEPDQLVGLCAERSPETVVAILAILKAGGAYLPLDPRLPAARLEFLLRDSRTPLVLVQRRFRAVLEEPITGPARPAVLVLEDLAESTAGLESSNPPSVTRPRDLAYAMFTSGTTGVPKGVLVPHLGIVRLVARPDYVRLGSDEVLLLFAPLSFDASTFEIWGALLHGARLVIAPPDLLDVRELGALLRRHGVTTLWLTSALFRQVIEQAPEALHGVRQLLSGGDVLPPDAVARYFELPNHGRLVNGYGPTENTTFTCCHAMDHAPEPGRPIPIGRPIAGTYVRLLDTHGQLVPVGVPGLLHTGGDGLARGYLNRPELTAERFGPDPYASSPDARLYRTGDLARYLPDGTLEFLGRLDHQVKIRGFRVEPEEIETVLGRHPGVAQAAVIVRRAETGDAQLHAFVVGSPGSTRPAPAELRAHLTARLPAYMVPSGFTILADLPLSPTGKVDRQALERQARAEILSGAGFVAPRTDPERAVAAVWQTLLQRPRVGMRDHFFELGGHSLHAITLASRLHHALGYPPPVHLVFRFPVLADFVAALDAVHPLPPTVTALKRGSRTPPLFFVHPVGGQVLPYLGLADQLHPDETFLALEHPELRTPEYTPRTVEELARLHGEAILAIQSKGPYLLGGWSMGGVLAFEIARQFQATGRTVTFLGLLDSVVPAAAPAAVRSPFERELEYFLQIHGVPASARAAGLALVRGLPPHRALETLHAGMRREGHLPAAMPFEFWMRLHAIYTDLRSALHRYRPARDYRGSLTLYRCLERPEAATRSAYWERLGTGGLVIRDMPGNHDTLLHPPHLEVLARELQSRLDAAREGQPRG